MQQPTVVLQQTGPVMGPTSTQAVCPSCQANISTRVVHETSGKTHLFAFIMCFLVCPCFWIPYCVDSCKNANHFCPNCNAFLGTYKT